MSSWAQLFLSQFVPVMAWKLIKNESRFARAYQSTYQIKHGSKRDEWTDDKKHSHTKRNFGSKNWFLETGTGFLRQSQNFQILEFLVQLNVEDQQCNWKQNCPSDKKIRSPKIKFRWKIRQIAIFSCQIVQNHVNLTIKLQFYKKKKNSSNSTIQNLKLTLL